MRVRHIAIVEGSKIRRSHFEQDHIVEISTADINALNVNAASLGGVASSGYSRTTHDHNMLYLQVFDIRRYGAKVDGQTDDTIACQAAIDAAHAARGTVYFPNGTTVTGTLTWKAYVNIVGEPHWGSVIKLKDNTNGNLFQTPDGAPNYYGSIQSLLLQGNKQNNTSGSAIYLYGAVTFIIDRLRIIEFAKHGIAQDLTTDDIQCIGVEIRGCDIWGCDDIGIATIDSGGADTAIINTNVGECLSGISLPNSCFLVNTNCWKNTQHGFYGYYAANCNLANCRAESNHQHGFIMHGCQDMQFTGCRAYLNNDDDGDFDGFHISGDSTKSSLRISITGGQIGLPGDKQKYGIRSESTYVDKIDVVGTMVKGNVTGQILLPIVNKFVITNTESNSSTLGGRKSGAYQPYNPGSFTVSKVALGAIADAKTGLDHHQGYCTDGSHHFVIDTAKITKYDSSWNVMTETTTPFVGVDAAIIHLCDGDWSDGRLYIPATDWNGVTSTKEHILVYDPETLLLLEDHDISSIADLDASSCVVVPGDGDNGIIYVIDYLTDTYIHKLDLSTYAELGTLTLTNNPAETHGGFQGITYKDGLFYISANNGYLYVADQQGRISLVKTTGLAGSHEGCDFFGDNLYVLLDNRPTSCKMTAYSVSKTASFQVGPDGLATRPLKISTKDFWEKFVTDHYDQAAFKFRIGQDANATTFSQNAYWTGSAWARDYKNGSAYPSMAFMLHEGSKQYQFRYAVDDNSSTPTWVYPLKVSGETNQPQVLAHANTTSVPALRANQANTGDIFDCQDNGSTVFKVKDGGAVEATSTIQAGGFKSADGSAGVSGSFTTTDGKTITIKDGIVTSIA